MLRRKPEWRATDIPGLDGTDHMEKMMKRSAPMASAANSMQMAAIQPPPPPSMKYLKAEVTFSVVASC